MENTINTEYSSFLTSATKKQWERIGLAKRSGVAVPLFSVYSKNSTGIGELPDLDLLADWCVSAGMSIIQLLPMNDVGFNFTPYDALSTFALEPVYLRLSELVEINLEPFKKELEILRDKFPAGGERVNYALKRAKLDLLWKIFESWDPYSPSSSSSSGGGGQSRGYHDYAEKNHFWLHDYSLFKVMKNLHAQSGWTDWPENIRCRKLPALLEIEGKFAKEIRFEKWVQWQLCEQFKKARAYARSRNIFLMGDLPFLVAKDSADVWANQHYFKLDLSSGAPPDAFFAKGQRWGMPPYNWQEIAVNHYDYLIEKVRYSKNFYDFFRIDHVVGTFRLWTIPLSEPFENGGLNGTFDPQDQNAWEEQGRKILSTMIEASDMLPCAEDLGVVPDCSNRVLAECAVPGMDVQRWTKDWDGNADFKLPEQYRKNSIAVISNHDMTNFSAWWLYEAGTVDGELFERKCRETGLSFAELAPRLFDPSRSKHGRLRWKDEISDVNKLAEIAGRHPNDLGELAGMYRGTYREKEKFWAYTGMEGPLDEKSSAGLLRRAIAKANAAASIFSVQLLQDWLDLGNLIKAEPWEFRINFPGTSHERNWSLVMPVSLEEMLGLELNKEIKNLNLEAGRR